MAVGQVLEKAESLVNHCLPHKKNRSFATGGLGLLAFAALTGFFVYAAVGNRADLAGRIAAVAGATVLPAVGGIGALVLSYTHNPEKGRRAVRETAQKTPESAGAKSYDSEKSEAAVTTPKTGAGTPTIESIKKNLDGYEFLS